MRNHKLIFVFVLVLLCLSAAFSETETGLQYIWNEPQGSVGNLLKIVGVFKNTDNQPVLAKLTAEVSYNNKLVDVVLSEPILVPQNSDVNLTIYYRPLYEGAYGLKTYVIYGQKVSQTEESSFLVLQGGAVAMGSVESILILVGVCAFAVVLHRRFNKENKSEIPLQPPR